MIRKIENKPIQTHRHHSDVERLQRVMLQNGYEADYNDAANIWDDYSDAYAAGWLGMPEDDNELWDEIKNRVEDAAI
jgi:hypothetical protein